MTSERCGRDYQHDRHSWLEGFDEWHMCDGGSDEVDELDRHELQDEDYERGMYH